MSVPADRGNTAECSVRLLEYNLVESVSSPSREDEGCSMDLLVVVSVELVFLLLGPGTQRFLDVGIWVLGADHEADLTGWIGWDGGVAILDGWEDSLAGLLDFLDDVHVKPDVLTLGGNDTLLGERLLQQLKVWLLEKSLGWTLWIRRVGDDDIKVVLVFLQELETIANVDSNLWMLEANRHGWKVLLGDFNDVGINVTQNRLLNTRVFHDFAQNTTIATTNHQHSLWLRMRVHGQMSDHLLIRKLISLGSLDTSIEHQNIPIVGALKNQNLSIPVSNKPHFSTIASV
jgi:hypothetical protein